MMFLFILLLDIVPDRFATLFEPGYMPPLMMSGPEALSMTEIVDSTSGRLYN